MEADTREAAAGKDARSQQKLKEAQKASLPESWREEGPACI